MSWLLVQIWSALAIAALLGLVFGWAVRGVGLKTRLRRLQAERDLVATDRDQLREELDTLYASRQSAGNVARETTSGSEELGAEIAKRDERLKALSSELSASKQELERLRGEAERAKAEAEAAARRVDAPKRESGDGALTGGGALAAGAAAGATLSKPAPSAGDNDERVAILGRQRDELTWRNRYLESRVRMLEETVSKAEQTAGASAAVAQPELAARIEALQADNDRLQGEVQTLRARPAEPDPAGRPAKDAETEQELARLRWRNRYLESRLDYLEGNPETAAEEARVEAEREAASAAQRVSEDAANVQARQAAGESAVPEPAGEREPPAPSAPTASQATGLTGTIETVDPSNDGPVSLGALGTGDGRAFSAPDDPGSPENVEPSEPRRLQAPREEGPDRLSDIDGIGPMIERALNQLGVFHVDQVAGWTPGEAMWIDRALGFNNGRVVNDDWAGKARALVSQRAN